MELHLARPSGRAEIGVDRYMIKTIIIRTLLDGRQLAPPIKIHFTLKEFV